jgi:CTP:molybdopterin cytidylyltransferase MocA
LNQQFLEKQHLVGIVLAAGFSKRMGTPKQCILLPNGLTLLHNACLLLADCYVHKILVALGGNAEIILEENTFLKKPKLKESFLEIVNITSDFPGMTETLNQCLKAHTRSKNAHFLTILCDNPALSSLFLESFKNNYFENYSEKKLVLKTHIQTNMESFSQPPMLFDACFANMLLKELQTASHDKLVQLQDRLKPWIEGCAAKHNYKIITFSFPASQYWHDLDTPQDVSTALEHL